jgi:hypothetical protein
MVGRSPADDLARALLVRKVGAGLVSKPDFDLRARYDD